VCLGKGIASTVKYQLSVASVNNIGNNTSSNVASGGYTNPIIHNNVMLASMPRIKGNASDYDITDMGNGTAKIVKFLGFDQEDTLIPTEINGKIIVGIGDCCNFF
jgi:hypothetical protein